MAASDDMRELEQLAESRWLRGQASALESGLAARICALRHNARALAFLDISCCLEHYLWPLLPSTAAAVDDAHLLAVILVCNEKFRQGLPVAAYLTLSEDRLHVLALKLVDFMHSLASSQLDDLTLCVTFLIHMYHNIEKIEVRKSFMQYLSIPLWETLSETRRALELETYPQLQAYWNDFTAKDKAEPELPPTQASKKRKKKDSTPAVAAAEARSPGLLFPHLFSLFFSCLDGVTSDASEARAFLLRFCELVSDLLSQLPTRRFFNTYLDDVHFIVRCKHSALWVLPEGRLFVQMVGMVERCVNARVDDQTGAPLSEADVSLRLNGRVLQLRKLAFTAYPNELKDVIYGSAGELTVPTVFAKALALLGDNELLDLAVKLGVVTDADTSGGSGLQLTREVVMSLMAARFTKQPASALSVNQLSLYPTETTIFDTALIPVDGGAPSLEVHPLPKLNLQFLSVHEYLVRTFELYRLESAYDIRLELCAAVRFMNPVKSHTAGAAFNGWARMAVPVPLLSMGEVSKPHIGATVPRRVTVYVEVDIGRFSGDVRQEWESLRMYDVVFLVCIANPKREHVNKDDGNAPQRSGAEDDMDTFCAEFGVRYVRGAEVLEMRDADGVVLNDSSRPDMRATGRAGGGRRRLTLSLDAAQYQLDVLAGVDCYAPVNLLVRRNAKENNFKSVLETLRDLVNTEAVEESVPSWMRDVLLGYGDPAAASFRSLGRSLNEGINRISPDEDADYLDTFLDAQHLIESFPHAEVSFGAAESVAPYRLEIVRGEQGQMDKIKAVSYTATKKSPYRNEARKLNSTRFTPRQVEAIRSGINEGLTVVVGPPGTGKSDTAVQIITALYHNYPSQRILLVTHSNAALNDLFAKIEERDIDPRHLLRLGGGEKDITLRDALEGEEQERFSKQGRVNWSLQRRIDVLAEVQRLAVSLGAHGDMGASCETAEYFYRDWISPLMAKHGKGGAFPFKEFFNDVSELVADDQTEVDVETYESCIRYINGLFEELSELRAFELLRSAGHRTDYLLTKQARIIAMTCTHAAILRKKLIELDFKYDSLIMEEAAQVLEVETLIPMLLQNVESSVDACRLKRIVLIGDHHQLPPIVKNSVFKNYSKFDQSLFSRLVRIGVPVVSLEKQGRCRPDIAKLFNWKYVIDGNVLGNLPVVTSHPEYLTANAGFLRPFQLVDVGPFQGKGESSPTPFYYQNLGEAEYVVATYQYMRLLGYPREKITILTTYNGQKDLIKDIITQRCKGTMFGYPAAVITVDKYQGQQNDYVLLSLVRTSAVGHIRDTRRLVVAMSRARLGLYIFCRQSLFESCVELMPVVSQLVVAGSSSKLSLVLGEGYPTQRQEKEPVAASLSADIEDVTAMGLLVYGMIQKGASATA